MTLLSPNATTTGELPIHGHGSHHLDAVGSGAVTVTELIRREGAVIGLVRHEPVSGRHRGRFLAGTYRALVGRS